VEESADVSRRIGCVTGTMTAAMAGTRPTVRQAALAPAPALVLALAPALVPALALALVQALLPVNA